MSAPKAIVFDLGKVLLEFDYGIVSRKLIAGSGRDAAVVRAAITHPDLLFRFETGLMTRAEFLAQVRRETDYSGTDAELIAIFSDIFAPMESMIALHAALRQRGLPTYIFSNTNEIAVDYIRKQYPFFANFDGYVYSYEVQAMKPDVKIYEAVEKMTGRTGRDILYIDDRPENIATGVQRGWQTILQETPEKTHAAVKGLGLL